MKGDHTLDQYGGAAGIRRHAPTRRDQSPGPYAYREHDDGRQQFRQGRADRRGADGAVERVMTCEPDYLVLGISACPSGAAILASVEDLRKRMKDRAGRDIGVTLAVDGVREALKLHGIKRKSPSSSPTTKPSSPRWRAFASWLRHCQYNHLQANRPPTAT